MKTTGLAALIVLLAATGVAAQPAVAANDLANTILDKKAALDALAGELAQLCDRAGYADVAICVDVMQNEKHVVMSSEQCVMFAGRAWGCSPDAFSRKQ